MAGPVIYLVRSWPRLSQTFVVNEVLALERRGVHLEIFSMVRSGEDVVQPQVADVRARVRYLEDGRSGLPHLYEHLAVLRAAPLRYLRTCLFALRHPELSAGYSTTSTLGCLRSAVQVAATVVRLRHSGSAPEHLHAHFAHDPTLVALLVHRLTGLSYSFTAHARDLVQIPPASLRMRAAEATALVTCCAANADYVVTTLSEDLHTRMHVIHHGVELDRFIPRGPRAVSEVANVVTIGRLVEKKGFPDLFRALHALKADGYRFVCRLYGDGPLLAVLEDLRVALGLIDEVQLLGEQDRDHIVAALEEADLFVLTPVETDDGDRDGIPNVLVEAMACGLAVVTTSAGGITELVQHRVNGLVSPPGDVAGVASQIAELLSDPRLREDLGRAARATVEADYDVNGAARQLEQILRPTDNSPGVR
jgi:glycosyltransferase involved in cell wall biosynthesis